MSKKIEKRNRIGGGGHPVSVISSISGPILDLKVPRVQGVRLLDSVLVSNLAPFQRCGVTTELVRYPTMQLFSISYIGINIQYSKSSLRLRSDLSLYRLSVMYETSIISEVSQLSPSGIIRTICLSNTLGLDTLRPFVRLISSPMIIPIGQSVLGRLFNVTASSMDLYIELLQCAPWSRSSSVVESTSLAIQSSISSILNDNPCIYYSKPSPPTSNIHILYNKYIVENVQNSENLESLVSILYKSVSPAFSPFSSIYMIPHLFVSPRLILSGIIKYIYDIIELSNRDAPLTPSQIPLDSSVSSIYKYIINIVETTSYESISIPVSISPSVLSLKI